jgi:uncharacterized protein YdcH (DUF465 family)
MGRIARTTLSARERWAKSLKNVIDSLPIVYPFLYGWKLVLANTKCIDKRWGVTLESEVRALFGPGLRIGSYLCKIGLSKTCHAVVVEPSTCRPKTSTKPKSHIAKAHRPPFAMPSSRHHHRSTNEINNDDEALEEASRLQQSTLAALRRIQSTAVETEESGVQSLAALKEQKDQFSRVFEAADRVDTGLQKTEQLQNKLSMWSLRFNKRGAKNEVDRQRNDARKLAQQHAKLAQKRLQEKRQDGDWSVGDDSNASSIKSQTKTMTTNAIPIKKKRSPKSSLAFDDAFAMKKDLLYGVDTTIAGGKYQAKLEELNEVDHEIDAALDVVATQVDTILTMGKEMRCEIRAQHGSINVLSDRMERSQYKQDIVNKRTTRFLDGKVRKKHNMVDTFGTGPLSRASAAGKAFLEI